MNVLEYAVVIVVAEVTVDCVVVTVVVGVLRSVVVLIRVVDVVNVLMAAKSNN